MKCNMRYNLVDVFTLLIGVLGLTLSLFVQSANDAASAADVQIASYDVEQTPVSGFGGWSHTYTGTITNTGRTISASASGPAGIANYAGGSGTLNDQMISTSTDGTHLFYFGNADDGQSVIPVITLHLGGTFLINEIRLFGGETPGNAFPGAINGATVEIGGTSVALTTIPFGAPNAIGEPVNDLLDLRDTALAGIATDRIVLRNFLSSIFGFPLDQFVITEITVDGSPPGISVAIDIRPHNKINRLEIRSHERVPVAILSDASFDAPTMVDRNSLTFGRTGNEPSLAFCQPVPQDMNRDGRADLVCVFNVDQAGFRVGDTMGVLKGRTTADVTFSGHDLVCVGICR